MKISWLLIFNSASQFLHNFWIQLGAASRRSQPRGPFKGLRRIPLRKKFVQFCPIFLRNIGIKSRKKTIFFTFSEKHQYKIKKNKFNKFFFALARSRKFPFFSLVNSCIRACSRLWPPSLPHVTSI